MLKKVHVQGLVISLIASSLLAACSGKRGFKPMPIKGADPLSITKTEPGGGQAPANTDQTAADSLKDVNARTRTAPVAAELAEEDKRVISETLEVEVKREEAAEGLESALGNLEKSIEQNGSALAGKVLGLSLKRYVVKNGTAAADFSEVVGIHVKTLVNEEDGVLSDRFFEGNVQLSGSKETQFVSLNEVRPGAQASGKESAIKVFASCQQDKCKSLRILVDATSSSEKPMAAVYQYIADEKNGLELKYVGGSLGSAYMSYEDAYKKYQEETYAEKGNLDGTDGKDLSVLPDGEDQRVGTTKSEGTAAQQDVKSNDKSDDKKAVEAAKPVAGAKADAAKVEVQVLEEKKDVRTDYSDTDGKFPSVLPINGLGSYSEEQGSDSSSSDSLGKNAKDRSVEAHKAKLAAEQAASTLGENPKDRSARLLKEKQQAQIERNNEVAKAYAAELAKKEKQAKEEKK